jgi:mono/diheme cytochrome c family protein
MLKTASLKIACAAVVVGAGMASSCATEKAPPPGPSAPIATTQKETPPPPKPPAPPGDAPPPEKAETSAKATPELIEQGRILYQGKGGCIACHGEDGVALLEIPSMPNFSDPAWEKKEKDAQIITALEDGKDLMPPYPGRASDFPALIAYVRSLSKASDAPGKHIVRRKRSS